MNKLFTYLLLFLSCGAVGYSIDTSFEIKNEIEQCEEKLQDAQNAFERSEILYKLALTYLYDQEVHKSFEVFLEALKAPFSEEPSPMKERERVIYEEALSYYLANQSISPRQCSEHMIKQFGQIAMMHPEYEQLNFLLSLSYANTGNYKEFIEMFYKGYKKFHSTFLAEKAKGILYLRLSKQQSDKKIRNQTLQFAVTHLEKALEKNPLDPSLYKTLVFLAKEEDNSELIHEYLKKIVEYKPQIARSDVIPYVKEAIYVGDDELAKSLVNYAKEKYPYSKAVIEAQDYINQQKGS